MDSGEITAQPLRMPTKWTSFINFTIFRNSGIALAVVSACIGSAAAPFVLELDRIHPTLPFAIMGDFAVAAALLCWVLPETRGRPTAEVYESNNNGMQHK